MREYLTLLVTSSWQPHSLQLYNSALMSYMMALVLTKVFVGITVKAEEEVEKECASVVGHYDVL